eukprot:166571-Prymnesium_polylepis.1
MGAELHGCLSSEIAGRTRHYESCGRVWNAHVDDCYIIHITSRRTRSATCARSRRIPRTRCATAGAAGPSRQQCAPGSPAALHPVAPSALHRHPLASCHPLAPLQPHQVSA